MIRLTLRRAGEGRDVSARGHARGDAALCAAVSGLLGALERWLRTCPGAEVSALRLEPGRARFLWRGGAGSDAVFELVRLGLLGLAAAEPEKIEVEEE